MTDPRLAAAVQRFLNAHRAAVTELLAALEVEQAPPARITAETAHLLPEPRGYRCAAGCGDPTYVHRVLGCDVEGCDCPAPFGRVLPSEEAFRG